MDIKKTLIQIYNLSDTDWENTIKNYVPVTIFANSSFLKQGDISDRLGFVKTGLLRAFFFDNDTNEITTHFFLPGSVVISVDSFNNQVKSKEGIVAIDNSELLVINYQKIKELYHTVPVWQQICKDVAESKNKDLIDRTVQFQTLTATERYQLFCQQYPEVVRKVALRHIASYLGIDIATLSRIRKKK